MASASLGFTAYSPPPGNQRGALLHSLSEAKNFSVKIRAENQTSGNRRPWSPLAVKNSLQEWSESPVAFKENNARPAPVPPAFVSRYAEDEPRKGADILVEALEREGVEHVFAYPGGASMEIHQALTRSNLIRNILCRHEQGEVFAAEGYARSSGKVGVCIATSGPGATNLATSVPPVAGQIFKGLCICYAVVGLTFFSIAVSDYWAFGNKSSVTIFSNLAHIGEPSVITNWLLFTANSCVIL